MAESILVLTHADETGSALTKASLEAVTAGKELAAQTRRFAHHRHRRGGCECGCAGGRGCGCTHPYCGRRGVCAAALCERCRCVRGALQSCASDHRAGAGQFAFCARHGRRCTSPWRMRRYAHHGHSREGSMEATRWFYRQRIEAVLTRSARPWFLLLDAGTHAVFAGESGEAQVETVAVELPVMRTTVTGMRVPAQDAQTIRPDAKMLFVAGAGWTKKQADGQVHATEAGELILKFPAQGGGVAGQLQVAGRPGRRRELRSPISDTPESDWTNGIDSAARQGAFDLLPWRGAARGGLAIHWRTAGDLARSELRMDARQGGRGLRGRCVPRDDEGE